ncbi:MAG: extracellular solute-binding protein [Candidatus Izemoplasmatales bacterium]
MKKIFTLMLFGLAAIALIGCSSDEPTNTTEGDPTNQTTDGDSTQQTTETQVPTYAEKQENPYIDGGNIVIWVGVESEEFYQGVVNDYIDEYNANPAYPYYYPHTIEIRAVDGGTAAGVFLDDPAAGPDILSVAHDNLGRLIAGSPAISPITDQTLLNQINSQNTEEIVKVITGDSEGVDYVFGVPYEAQSLVLYYNNKYLNEEDVKTWEGIWAKAKELNKQAVAVTGIDGFNNSFLVLSSFAETGEMPVSIYEGGVLTNTELVNDGMISIMKWGQRFFSDPNGAGEASDSGWEVDLANEAILSIVGGSWHFNAATSALGENLSVAVLPTYTLTADDVYGTIEAGTVMQSGTFADAKMFVMNKRSPYLQFLQPILTYMTEKSIQEASFLENGTLPAYKDALTEFDGMSGDDILTQLAVSQIQMFEHGIPQPFGVDARYNFYYYQKQGPEKLFDILMNTDGAFSTDAEIIAQMEIVEAIWRNNN